MPSPTNLTRKYRTHINLGELNHGELGKDKNAPLLTLCGSNGASVVQFNDDVGKIRRATPICQGLPSDDEWRVGRFGTLNGLLPVLGRAGMLGTGRFEFDV